MFNESQAEFITPAQYYHKQAQKFANGGIKDGKVIKINANGEYKIERK